MRPATWLRRHRTVAMVCAAQAWGHARRVNPMKSLEASLAQPEEDRMRVRLATGHPRQAEAGRACLVDVLRLPALVGPAEDRVRGLHLGGPVTRDDVRRVGLAVKQLALTPPGTRDDQVTSGSRAAAKPASHSLHCWLFPPHQSH